MVSSGARSPRRPGVAGARETAFERRRDHILREAAQLFFAQGYLQTSVDAIAERMGATKPVVYHHFGSKIDLLTAICEHATGDALAATDKAMAAPGGPRARFEHFVRAFTEETIRNHRFVAIYFREQINLPADVRQRINHMRRDIDQRLRSLLSDGIASGEFEIGDPAMSALVIAGMSSYSFAWYREKGRLDASRMTDHIVQMMLKLVRAAPAANSR